MDFVGYCLTATSMSFGSTPAINQNLDHDAEAACLHYLMKKPFNPGLLPHREQCTRQRQRPPSKPMIARMLSDLKKDGILMTIRPPSGRRSEVLAFAQWINLAEGKKVI
jgi:hypothetical protein